MSRNTRTGSVLERMLLPALEQGGYRYRMKTRYVGEYVEEVVARLSRYIAAEKAK